MPQTNVGGEVPSETRRRGGEARAVTEENPLIAMRGISKSFGGVRANADVELVLQPGEILGLLGENGAGKTTLMNILFGVYQADQGSISVEGKPLRIQSA